MSDNGIDKAYVSPYDHFLFEFDATHTKSASQMKEIEKHALLDRIRDDKDYDAQKGELWDGF